MNVPRRRLLKLSLALPALAGAPLGFAQSGRGIRLLVGFPPGGGTDAIARLLAEKLQDPLGEPVIVDNRPGAGGQIAAQVLKSAPADGRTLFLTHDHTISILPQVVAKPGFDPDRDFVPAGGFATFVNCFAVSAAAPARTFAEYVQWVERQGHGRSAVGIPAPASTPEFLVQSIARRFELDLLAAPYRGSAPMIADMLGNQIPAGIGSVQDFLENHKAGKLRVLAVLGGRRQSLLPDAPTFGELGLKGFEDTPYYGIYAPRGTPGAFLSRFSKALAQVVAMPDVRAQLAGLGLDVEFMTPAQLHSRERAYSAAWKRIIKDSGFMPQ